MARSALYLVLSVLLCNRISIASAEVAPTDANEISKTGVGDLTLCQLNRLTIAIGSEGFLKAHLLYQRPVPNATLSALGNKLLALSESLDSDLRDVSNDMALRKEQSLLLGIQRRLVGAVIYSTFSDATDNERRAKLENAITLLRQIKSNYPSWLLPAVKSNCIVAEQNVRFLFVPSALIAVRSEDVVSKLKELAGRISPEREKLFWLAETDKWRLHSLVALNAKSSPGNSTLLNQQNDVIKAIIIACRSTQNGAARPMDMKPHLERFLEESRSQAMNIHQAHVILHDALRKNPNRYLSEREVLSLTEQLCGSPRFYFFACDGKRVLSLHHFEHGLPDESELAPVYPMTDDFVDQFRVSKSGPYKHPMFQAWFAQ